MKSPGFRGAKLPGKNLLFQPGKWLRPPDLPRLACEGHVCPGAGVCGHARALCLQGLVILNGPHHSSDSHHSGASKNEREKKILRTQIPFHKAHGGAFSASAICHHKIHNSSRVSRHGHFCRGHPEQCRRPDSETMCSKVKTGEKILLNKQEGSTAQRARST